MGDVTGVGPEIIASAWPKLLEFANPVVIGDASKLAEAIALVGSAARVQSVSVPSTDLADVDLIPCLPGSPCDLSKVQPGRLNASAGRAAFDFLIKAIDL